MFQSQDRVTRPEEQTASGPPALAEEIEGGVEEEHRDGVVEETQDIDRVDAVRATENQYQHIWRHLHQRQ